MWFRKDTVPLDESALTAALLITFENLRAALLNPERKTGTSRFSSGYAWHSYALASEISVKYCCFFIVCFRF